MVCSHQVPESSVIHWEKSTDVNFIYIIMSGSHIIKSYWVSSEYKGSIPEGQILIRFTVFVWLYLRHCCMSICWTYINAKQHGYDCGINNEGQSTPLQKVAYTVKAFAVVGML